MKCAKSRQCPPKDSTARGPSVRGGIPRVRRPARDHLIRTENRTRADNSPFDLSGGRGGRGGKGGVADGRRVCGTRSARSSSTRTTVCSCAAGDAGARADGDVGGARRRDRAGRDAVGRAPAVNCARRSASCSPPALRTRRTCGARSSSHPVTRRGRRRAERLLPRTDTGVRAWRRAPRGQLATETTALSGGAPGHRRLPRLDLFSPISTRWRRCSPSGLPAEPVLLGL